MNTDILSYYAHSSHYCVQLSIGLYSFRLPFPSILTQTSLRFHILLYTTSHHAVQHMTHTHIHIYHARYSTDHQSISFHVLPRREYILFELIVLEVRTQ